MTLTPDRQRQIIAKESAWVDDGFGQLDLTAFPALNQLPPPQSHDTRWAKDWRDTPLTASGKALRGFVSDPDAESLERVGDEIGHEGFRVEVRQRKGESVAARFKSACPDYLPTDANYDMIVDTLAFNALPDSQREGETDKIVADLIDDGFWTVANLRSCFLALHEEGLLEIAAGSTRALSTSERLQVTRIAQSGRADAWQNTSQEYAEIPVPRTQREFHFEGSPLGECDLPAIQHLRQSFGIVDVTRDGVTRSLPSPGTHSLNPGRPRTIYHNLDPAITILTFGVFSSG